MRNAVAFRFSDDSGRLLENLVFIELKRRNAEVWYFRGKQECDFVIRDSGAITSAIQVCYELTASNREREIGGLVEAMTGLGLDEGFILTYNQEETIPTEQGRTITVVPVWRWLLGKK